MIERNPVAGNRIGVLHDAYRASLPAKARDIEITFARLGKDPDAPAELYKLVHRLAGSSGMYGFDHVAALARRLLRKLDGAEASSWMLICRDKERLVRSLHYHTGQCSQVEQPSPLPSW